MIFSYLVLSPYVAHDVVYLFLSLPLAYLNSELDHVTHEAMKLVVLNSQGALLGPVYMKVGDPG